MGTPVEKFIRDAHVRYSIKGVITPEYIRSVSYKLGMADIKGEVSDSDTPLALDIILAAHGKAASTLRTAAATSPVHATSLRSAGLCPRCSGSMTFAKLADTNEARYCEGCHVVIPV